MKEQAGVQGAFAHQYGQYRVNRNQQPQITQQPQPQPYGQAQYGQPYDQQPLAPEPDQATEELRHLQTVFEKSQAMLAEEYNAMVAEVQARPGPVNTARPRGRVVPSRPAGAVKYHTAVSGVPYPPPMKEQAGVQGGIPTWQGRNAFERTQLRGEIAPVGSALRGRSAEADDVPIAPWSPSAGIVTKASSAVAAEGCHQWQGGSPTWHSHDATARRQLSNVAAGRGGPSDELRHLQRAYEERQAMLAEEYEAMVAEVQAR